MGYSRDDKPWIGPVPNRKNVYMAAGFTGHGMPNCWLSGKAVADIVRRTLAGLSEVEAVRMVCVADALPKSDEIEKGEGLEPGEITVAIKSTGICGCVYRWARILSNLVPNTDADPTYTSGTQAA